MKLSFVGLGYVGLVSSICLAAKKHKIFGYDKDLSKIELLKSKESFEGLIKEHRKKLDDFKISNSRIVKAPSRSSKSEYEDRTHTVSATKPLTAPHKRDSASDGNRS